MQLRAVWAVVVLMAGLFAGCLGEVPQANTGPTPPAPTDVILHTLDRMEQFSATSADGTVLRGQVYLPKSDGPLATVLEYSPYWNTQNGRSDTLATELEDGRTTLNNWLAPFLDAGFAVAVVNLRGFGVSDGCMDLGGIRESQDVRAVIDALAAQPWSNGNVGMVGLSYPGWMQYVALRDPSPHLKTIIPVSGIIDFYSLTSRTGAVTIVGPALSGIIAALSIGGPATNLALGNGEVGETRPDHVPCASIVEGEFNDFMRLQGDRNDFWAERDYRDLIAPSGLPILATNGLTNLEGHILQFDGLWERLPPGSRLLVGQWQHGYPGEVDETYAGPDYDALAVAWMDQHLRGGPVVPTGFVEYEDTDRVWRTTSSWPPPGQEVVLHLSQTGLAPEAPTAPSVASFASSDENPEASACDDRAMFVSEPLAEDVLLAGYFTANLSLSSTLPDGNLVVNLWHGQPGADCEPGDASEVRRGITDLRHRGHLAIGRDFPLGTPDRVMLQSYPFAVPVKAGERLILTIAGGSDEIVPDPLKPTITVHGGGGEGSRITVNVVEGNLQFG